VVIFNGTTGCYLGLGYIKRDFFLNEFFTFGKENYTGNVWRLSNVNAAWWPHPTPPDIVGYLTKTYTQEFRALTIHVPRYRHGMT